MTAVVAFQLLQSTADKWAATYLDRSVLLNKIFLTLNTGLLFSSTKLFSSGGRLHRFPDLETDKNAPRQAKNRHPEKNATRDFTALHLWVQ